MALAIVVAVGVPLIFLYLVRWLDLYASGSFGTVMICMAWGVIAFFTAYVANGTALRFVAFSMLVRLVAPIIEEALKSLILVYQVRRPDFTYFVDGAIYGFAVGTAFGALENLLYLSHSAAGVSLSIALSRTFTTSLMHSSASALVGVCLGRFRFGRGPSRLASLVLGWIGAMSLHITFNNLISREMGTTTLLLAVVLGLGGVGLNAGLILWGLREERKWLRETLGLNVGVSVREAALVQQMADLDTLLAPVARRFGREKRRQVESFLRLQAQLGLKRRVQELTPNSKLREEMALQVATMRQEVDSLRRTIGVYCMTYVRSILPPETEPLWSRLAVAMATDRMPTMNLWAALGTKIDARAEE